MSVLTRSFTADGRNERAAQRIGAADVGRDPKEDALAGTGATRGQEAHGVEQDATVGQLEQLRTLQAPLVAVVAALVVELDVLVTQDWPESAPWAVPVAGAAVGQVEVRLATALKAE